MTPLKHIDALGRRLGRCHAGLAAVELALMTPILLALIFAVVVYSIYFAAYLGVRQAATEGARAAMAGMSTSERSQLAIARATAVIAPYTTLLGASAAPVIVAAQQSAGLFQVSITYNISTSPIMGYARLLPLPSSTLKSNVIVANGSY